MRIFLSTVAVVVLLAFPGCFLKSCLIVHFSLPGCDVFYEGPEPFVHP